ncbi:MAG: hypothetical protein E2O77_11565, partial [Caldithrix sp.]
MVQDKEVFLGNVVKTIDAIFVAVAFVAAYFLSFLVRDIFGLGEFYYASAPTIQAFLFFTNKYYIIPVASIPTWLLLLSVLGAYRDIRTKTVLKEFEILLKAGVLATIVLGSLIFVFKMTVTSRLFIAVYAMVTVVVLSISRVFIRKFFDYLHQQGYNQVNLLIVGTGKRAREFIDVVKSHANLGLRIVGLIDDEHGMFG